MSEFTDEELKTIEPFVTNTSQNVFVLTNLPEVIKGALFSRYSRSVKSLRRLLIDEFLKDPQTGLSTLSFDPTQAEAMRTAVKKAQDFYDRVLDGYGDDSVGELGGAHVAIENVSMIATKVLEDARIGGSPLEKSTRYVWFDQKVNGDFLFLKEPTLMATNHKQLYLDTCRKLFQAYCDLIAPMTDFVKDNFPLDNFPFFDPATKTETPFKNISDEKLKKRAAIAYNSAVRAKACDVLRGLLPASTVTNMGIYGNGRFFQGLLSRLYNDQLAEMQAIGKEMHEELDKVIPSFVRRAKSDPYIIENNKTIANIANKIKPITSEVPVVLTDFDDDLAELVAAILYPHSGVSFNDLKKKADSMSDEEQLKIISAYIGNRKVRRDKPGRAFEHIYYTFDILADYGIYRDLHRHRVLTQQRQLLTTDNGFELPDEIIASGNEKLYVECMQDAKKAFDIISKDHPLEAQYVVPLAYRIRWSVKINLREAFHLIELRSTPQGHAGYRKIAQLMFKEIEKVHPLMAKEMKFVDMKDYPLGRMGAELKKEEKREKREAGIR